MADKKWTEVKAATTDTKTWDRSEPIEGEIIKVQKDVGRNNSKLYTLLTKDGEVAVWGSTTLDTKFAELYIGDQVRVEPLGKVKSPHTGREYWDFKVSYIEGERKPQLDENGPEVTGFDKDDEINLDQIPF